MPQLPFDTRIDRAGHLIVLTRRFYDVWWLYIGVDTRPIIIGAMNRFPEFFRFDEHAHFVSLITHLACLFEKRTDTINFEALIDEAESQNLVRADLITVAKSALSSVGRFRPKIALLRSNLFSHRSGSLPYDEAFRRAGVTAFDLRAMTEAGLEIANALLAGRGQSVVLFSATTLEHTMSMLRGLGESNQRLA